MSFINKVASAIGWVWITTLLAFIVVTSVLLLRGTDVSPEIPSDSVAVVELTGEIINSKSFIEVFDKALNQDHIKAIVVRIDSPGGAVGASEEIYRVIKNATKPVVCSFGSVAASGGLYAAMACNKILSNRGTLTGSIGVILALPSLHQALGNFGIGLNVIKSGAFKDSGSPFREMNPQDQQLLQHVVDSAHGQFVDVVSESRQLSKEAVAKIADGRIIVGQEALELGLVDEIGGLEQAAQTAFQLAGFEGEPKVQRIEKSKGLKRFLEDFAESKLTFLSPVGSSPQLKYLLY